MAIVFRNNATTALASDITNSATSITVTDGSKLPSITGSDYFYCTLDDGTNNEIVKVTAISGNTLTVVRAQDNTTARAFSTGDLAELRLTAAVLETFAQTDVGEITADEFIGDLRGAVIFKAQAGEAVSKGDVVYVSGITGNTPVVSKADADDSAKMPAFGLILTTASLNASTEVVTFGTISGVDTSAFSLGDTLYVSTTAGTLTATKPTGESALIQNIGKIQRVHASAGSIKVGGAGRTNDVPNLNDGNIFIGNGSNQSSTASLNTKVEEYLDGGTSTPTFSTLNVSGNTTLTGDLTVNGTTTSLNTNTLDVEDKNITLNYSTGDSSASADGSGITIQDAVNSTTDATILWDAANDQFDFSHGITLPDNKKAIFGTGSDLSIFHDGANSFIDDSGTGNLYIRANNLWLQKYTGETFIKGVADAEVTLYHNNQPKLATSSSGIDITGTVTSDGVSVAGGSITVNNYLTAFTLPNNSNQHMDVAKSFIINIDSDNNSTSEFFNVTYDNRIKKALTVQEGGDVSFYDDTGTSQNLKWDASADTLNFVDGARVSFGASNDLRIFHDGNHSYIEDGGTGNLRVRATNLNLANLVGNNYINCVSGGAVTLYYDNAVKLATTSSGINVTGDITANAENAELQLVDTSSGNTTSILSNNFDTTIKADGRIFFRAGGSTDNIIQISSGGDISFYDDTGSTQGLFWDASAERLGIGTTSPSRALHVNSSSIDSGIRVESTDANTFIEFKDSTTTTIPQIGGKADDLVFRNNDTESMRITSGASVGIGTTNPQGKLNIVRTSSGATRSDFAQELVLEHPFNVGLSILGADGRVAFGDSVDNDAGLIRYAHGVDSMIFSTAGTEALRVDSSQNLLLGATSTAGNAKFYLRNGSSGQSYSNVSGMLIDVNGTSNSYYGLRVGSSTGPSHLAVTNAGNVGIGTGSPNYKLHVAGAAYLSGGIQLNSSDRVKFGNGNQYITGVNDTSLTLVTGNSASVTVLDNGSVGIGTTSPGEKLSVSGGIIRVQNGSNTTFYEEDKIHSYAANGFVIDGREGLTLETSTADTDIILNPTGNVGIGTDSPNKKLHVKTDTDGDGITIQRNSTTAGTYGQLGFSPSTNDAGTPNVWIRGYRGSAYTDNYMTFGTGGNTGSERMRITSSGELLLNKTLASVGTDGVQLRPGSYSGFSATSTTALFVNRNTDDGDVVEIGKNGVKVGSLSVASNDLNINGGTNHSGIRFQATGLYPLYNGNSADGTIDLGATGQRFKDLHLSNQVYINGTTPNIRFTDSDTGADSQVSASSGYGALVLKADYNAETAGSFIGFEVDGSERARIDSSGHLLVGTTSVGYSGVDLTVGDTTDSQNGLAIQTSTTGIGYLLFGDGTGASAYVGQIAYAHSDNSMQFRTAGAERMRIDSSGSVGIGTSSPSTTLHVADTSANITIQDSNSSGNTAAAKILFADSGTFGTIGTIGFAGNDDLKIENNHTGNILLSGGNVGIGTDNPTHVLHVKNSSPSFLLQDSNQTGRQTNITHSSGIAKIRSRNNTSNGLIAFEGYTPSTTQEYGRFDSSGNLLVGTTSTTLYSATSGGGILLDPNGPSTIARESSGTQPCLILNNTGSDGEILQFRKDGSTVGSIGSNGGNLTISGTTNKAGLYFSGNKISPMLSNTRDDNEIDLGGATFRFKDIYATNGTIQTSDINEKQDIEDLSEAETRVAVAAKGLLKKYRWKSAVADKGDDARIHFGIMAQDLQQAFSAEGLNAGDYGMFISTTWTDETTGEEKTRLGVRYNELLAFIIAAI